MSISVIGFLLLILVGGTLCIIKSPFYGILIYEINYFLNPAVRWWYHSVPDLRWAYIIALILLSGFILRYKDFQNNRLMSIPSFRWLALITVIVFLSQFWAYNIMANHELSIRFYKYLFYAILLYKIIDSEEKLDLFVLVYIIGVFYISWVAWSTGRNSGGRLEGIGPSDGQRVNGTAAVVVTAVPFLIYTILFSSKKWMKYISLVAAAFVLNCLVLLNSRGAFLAAISSSGWIAFAVFRDNGLKNEKRKMIIGFILGIILFLYLADNVFWDRMSTLKTVKAGEGGATRVLYWFKTFEMLKDYPYGLGGDGYKWASPNYLPKEWLSEGLRAVHSTWFEVLSSFGYQGIIAFLGYVSSTFLFAHKLKKYVRFNDNKICLKIVSIEAAFIAYLTAGTFINRFYAELTWWLPALLGSCYNIYYKQSKDNI